MPCLEQTEAEVGPGERLLANGVGVHIVLQVAIRQQSLLTTFRGHALWCVFDA